MLVRLKRQFVGYGRRFRARSDGVEIPDGITLPRDALVQNEDGEWVTPAEYEPPKPKPAKKKKDEEQSELDL